MRRRILLGAGLLLLAGCGGKSDAQAKRPSERARDSAIAGSNIPGARAVGAAMRVSDSADARRKREDSVSNAVP